ncbi:DUF2254 domain-containing protein [Microbacterium atlanticum]|uniref:DUF2254 domain-containing protein n=1 Tax=Microbacterium atlanticum TaxID=2782168 RepID=UPI0018878DB9|nr:DUF2254 domain-containing protein [Microbacterium atlanticum]
MAEHTSRAATGSRARGSSGRGPGSAWYARLSESVESRLWPLPLAVIAVAVALGILLPRVDLLVDASLPDAVDSAVFNGGADTARSVLSSIAGSLITATSLTFSLTVIALQLASTQASPRVLRLFARDRQVHWTLAAFLGTFAYAITVLRSVRSPSEDTPEFVPRISVTVAFVLTIVSVVMLIFFLAHLAKQLRVETMLKDIHAETDRAVRLVGDRSEAVSAFHGQAVVPRGPTTVRATASGFITGGDLPTLVQLAEDHGIVVEELRQVGDNIVAGTDLARWWVPDEEAGSADEPVIAEKIRRIYAIRFERTSVEDIRYGMQQIVDIALRALSPGVNDPTTAVHAVGHLSAILIKAVAMPRPPEAVAGPTGLLRVVTHRTAAADDLEAALEPIRHYGSGDQSVVARFIQLIEEVSSSTRNRDVLRSLIGQLDALAQQLEGDRVDPATSEKTLRAALAARQHLALALEEDEGAASPAPLRRSRPR